ncbi:MAG TPA: NAD-dependent epimerase/dehydratase family protein [Candidatus Paceibacterota bacterium]
MTVNIIQEDIKTIADTLGDRTRAFSGKTVLLSGGAGFLGSYFRGVFDYLNKNVLDTPVTVISLDNYITGSEESFIGEVDPQYIRSQRHDIREPFSTNEPVDYIIHAAGIASPVYYKKYPIETIESAIYGAKHLLELARKKNVISFLFFSSSEIYGDPSPGAIPTPETYKGHVSSIGPRSCYDESKRLTETLCVTYHTIYNTPIKIVRPFNVYGPGMKTNDHRVMPTFIARGLQGQNLPVHGHGNQTRTFCYITDAIDGFLRVLLSDRNGEVYNIGIGDEEINMATLAQTVAEALDNGIKVEMIEYPDTYPADEPNRRCPDITKARTHLGYEPRVDLKTGLSRSIRWFKETNF